MTEPEPLQQIDRTWVRFRGRRLSYFSGCDYFRLASHPQVLAALVAGAKQFSLSVAASRLTTGNHILYQRLEKVLAKFFRSEDAVLVSTGYLSDVIAAQALVRNFSHALIDERAHPALVDASRFLDCPVLQFRHRNPASLAQVVARCGPGSRVFLLTDGMFAHDGSVAPLKDYLKALPKDARILVDDAHGAGVLGANGRGSLEHSEVSRRRVIQTITLTKAFGTYGGAILGPASLRRSIVERSKAFVGSTPVPLPLAAATLESMKLLRTNPQWRRELRKNSDHVKTALRAAGYHLPETPGPIIPLPPLSKTATGLLRQRLLDTGIYPPFVQYPGGPQSGFFRFVISNQHTREQLDQLVEVLVYGLASKPHCAG
jgi:glycine C-acetyltransferase/8-amino-7-oxononanoate synthase